MNKDELIVFALGSIEVAQSFFAALFLLFLYGKEKKSKSKLFLALALFCFTLNSILEITLYFKLLSANLYYLETALYLLCFVFLYAHIDSLLLNRKRQHLKIVFTIGAIGFLLGGLLQIWTLISTASRPSLVSELYVKFTTVFTQIIPIILLFKVYLHNTLVEKQYSNVANKRLDFLFYWLLLFNIYLITTFFWSVSSLTQEIVDALVSLCITLGLVYNALYHEVSENLFTAEATATPKKEKNVTNTITTTHTTLNENLFHAIENYLNQEKAYLHPDLSLNELSTHFQSKNQIISQTINHFSETTFYNFINAYRVAHFKALILQNKNDDMSIDGLIELCGFKSKSTFYKHFKRIENQTPSEFIESVIN